MKKIVLISGPTASGKSHIALQLAKSLNAEIVNADSIQVYKHFNIGSAKPTAEDLALVPHHLVSILEPQDDFQAGKFVELADQAIAEIVAKGKAVVVVGGTGLYIKALLHGLASAPAVAEQIKERLAGIEENLRENYPPDEFKKRLHQHLESIDPQAAAMIMETDLARMRRALEVFMAQGQSVKKIQDRHGFREVRYCALNIIVCPPREILYTRINERVDRMLAYDWLDEVKTLMADYKDTKPMNSIGYRRIAKHLAEELTYEEMVRLIKQDTRQYAKRQLTWWRNEPRKLGWTDLTENWLEECAQDQSVAHLTRFVKHFLDAESAMSFAPIGYITPQLVPQAKG